MVGTPGVHGVVTGTHGMGVSTPSAAAVAAATVGLAGERHMPSVGMFTMGAQSMMLAPGGVAAVTVGTTTMRLAGATPIEHCIIDPMLTSFPDITHSSHKRLGSRWSSDSIA
jgi:hypothetical protein